MFKDDRGTLWQISKHLPLQPLKQELKHKVLAAPDADTASQPHKIQGIQVVAVFLFWARVNIPLVRAVAVIHSGKGQTLCDVLEKTRYRTRCFVFDRVPGRESLVKS